MLVLQISLISLKIVLKYSIDLVDCLNNGNFWSSLYKLILNLMVLLLIFMFLISVSINYLDCLNLFIISPWWYAILVAFCFSSWRSFSYCFTHVTASLKLTTFSGVFLSPTSSELFFHDLFYQVFLYFFFVF